MRNHGYTSNDARTVLYMVNRECYAILDLLHLLHDYFSEEELANWTAFIFELREAAMREYSAI